MYETVKGIVSKVSVLVSLQLEMSHAILITLVYM